jgi:vacuole morphology and inheritance protein 14
MFLVNWINLLDSIPDLELISHLPAFLKGLLQFLSDPNEDVRTATQQALNGFLQDIRKIAEVKKLLERRRRLSQAIEESDSASGNSKNPEVQEPITPPAAIVTISDRLPEDNYEESEDWVPSEDIQIDYAKIISILIPCLSDSGIPFNT